MNLNAFTEEFSHSHQPLNGQKQQIRLLKLERIAYGPIRCSIDVFDLSTAPSYSALSYRWGLRVFDHQVLVNGRSFKIGGNLYKFLETFRREEENTYLWIDQICIEQANVQERNHQVRLMSKIYGQSSCTIVWLCDDEGLYSTCARNLNNTGKKPWLAPLLKDPYFRRLWIVQEVLLSRRVRILTNDNVWVTWETVRRCLKTKGWESTPAKSLILFEFDREGRQPDLSWCIRTFSGYECEDPRDKVYGLLGLVREEERLMVDYKKSPDEVWLDTVLSHPIPQQPDVLWDLGEDMGIDIAAMSGLDSFLAIAVPMPIQVEGDERKSIFVTAIGVAVVRRRSVPDLRSITSKHARVHNAKLKYALSPRSYHPAREHCYQLRHGCATFGINRNLKGNTVEETWNIIEEIEHRRSRRSRAAKQRWSAFKREMFDPPLKPHDMEPTAWYRIQNGKVQNFSLTPDWEAFFRLGPKGMGKIIDKLREVHQQTLSSNAAEVES